MIHIRHIKKYQVVSFDIFDTLIKRSVAKPSDLFEIIEEYCLQVKQSAVPGFAEKRKIAEQRANDRTGGFAGLNDIYDELKAEYNDFAETLKALEIDLEIAGCLANESYTQLYQQCISDGKIVVLSSDMYLPREVIVRMLDKCGIRGYQKLYLSWEDKVRKSDGSTYRAILDDFQIRSSQLLHIGDNWKSDCLRPFFMGIRYLRVPVSQKDLCSIPREISSGSGLAWRTVRTGVDNCCSRGMTRYERLGCRTFGPLLFGFVQWLSVQLRKDGIRDVFFMSRDGYMMKRAFDVLGAEEFHTHYLYCSRRSYTVPMIWTHPDIEEVFQNITIQDKMTLRTFLLRMGLKPEKYIEEATRFGLELDRLFEHDTFKSSNQVRAFYHAIQDDVIQNSKIEYDALLAYIRSWGLSGHIAVVDIGHYGTMQNVIGQLIRREGISAQVKGYYVCLSPAAELVNSGLINATGYLYEYGRNEACAQTISKLVPIFESVFLAQHGSVKRFAIQDGKAVPVLYEYEYKSEQDKCLDEIVIIKAYQSGALAFVRYMVEAGLVDAPIVGPDVALREFARMGTAPKLWEAELWGNFRMFDNTIQMVARPQMLINYIKRPQMLIEDFKRSNWKIGFMRRVMKLPLPYEKIYELLKKQYHRKEG